METTNASDGEEAETSVSVARGGPIYVPNLVGPLTGVPQFESTLLYEIQDLKAQLCLDASSPPPDEDDLSIDELKVFTDEELVEMALNNTPKDQSKNISSSLSSEELLNARTGIGEDSSAAVEQLNGGTCCDGTIGTVKSRRRKRSLKQSDGSHNGNNCNTPIVTNNSRKGKGSKAKKYSIDESCHAKVDELLKIKQKQDEDRAAARLHSLKYLSNCKDSKVGSTSLERSEGITYLKSTKSAKQQLKPSNIEEHIAVQNPEVVLCIEVYHSVRNWIKTQEFLVLGRQTLTELRDKIYCMTDQVMQKAGTHDPSGYFLIEDVFCNDTRDPSAIDYSEPIFDWLRNSKDDALRKWECIISGDLQRKQKAVVGESTTSQLPQFRRADMQKVRFCDMRFRLGAGYLYCHQGDCKHTIVIRDMRLVHPDDVQNRAAYPIVIFRHKPRFQKCNICKIFRATKLTVDDKWTPCNPCYFCNDCYYLLHYSENGSLLYSDFSTFDYLHD